jgi:hypothetical protein
MAEDYGLGQSRLWYRATGFKEGLIVKADIWSPSLAKHFGLGFTEEADGFYYLDYTFLEKGTYVMLVYEDGIKVTSQNFKISRRGIPGGNVLN